MISTYTFGYAQVDWACGIGRLGDKPYLNALLYKSLTAMSYLAREIGEDEKAKEWDELLSFARQNGYLGADEKMPPWRRVSSVWASAFTMQS